VEDLNCLFVCLLIFVVKTRQPFSVRFVDTRSQLEVYLIFILGIHQNYVF